MKKINASEMAMDIEEKTQVLYDEIEQLIEDTRLGNTLDNDVFDKMVIEVIQGLAKVYK